MAADAASAGAYFATRFANNLLPAWFNFVFSSVRLLALRKCTPGADGLEDARPVGIGCALRRAVSKAVVARASHKAAAAGYFAPQQLGVAVPSGGAKLVLSLRELLDAEREFCIVAVDISNAFNSVSRAQLLRCLTEPRLPDELRALARLALATLAHEALVFAGGGSGGAPLRELGFRSSEGVQQGAPESSFFFAAVVQPLLEEFDARLALDGGTVRGAHDDLYLLGRPRDVFPALADLTRRLEELGLRANAAKSQCWIDPRHLASLEACRGSVPLGSVPDGVGGAY
jgi:hypothetical protein